MSDTGEAGVLAAEERLRLAMLASDLAALDDLLAPELIFTTHLGQLVGKAEDLAAHKSGLIRILEIIPSERHVRLCEEMAIVSVRMRMKGVFEGRPSNGDFRFTRVWALFSGGSWKIIAGHASRVTA